MYITVKNKFSFMPLRAT